MNDSAPVPIRPDVEPSMDAARELRDWVWQEINKYVEKHGEPPHSIALALIGKPVAGAYDHASSWTPTDEKTSMQSVNATASMLFQGRALGIF